MAAVRPKLALLPVGGAERAWSMSGAPMVDFLDMKPSPVSPAELRSATSSSSGKAATAPQPNVKKLRRRVALLSGVRLNLPSSPVNGPSPPGSSRAYTFTAEWDSTNDGFVFSDLESSSSSSSSARSNLASPIPTDVDENEVAELEILPPPLFEDIVSLSSSLSHSPSSPAVSDIFDLYSRTPSADSFSFGDSSDSASTAPSSRVNTPSPISCSPPLHKHKDSRFAPPTISVTFFQEDEAQDGFVAYTTHYERAFAAMDRRRLVVAPASAFETASWEPILSAKSHAFPPVPQSAGSPRKLRPLPPLPVRTGTQASSATRRDEQRCTRASSLPFAPRKLSMPLSAPPSLHTRGVSLSGVAYGFKPVTLASIPKRTVSGYHTRSISEAPSAPSTFRPHRPHHF